jgi:hypothetical protein
MSGIKQMLGIETMQRHAIIRMEFTTAHRTIRCAGVQRDDPKALSAFGSVILDGWRCPGFHFLCIDTNTAL